MTAGAHSRKEARKARQRRAWRLLALASLFWIAGIAIVWFYTWPPATQIYDAAYYAGQRDCQTRYAGNYERVQRCIDLFNLQYLRSRNGHAVSGILVALFPPLLAGFALHIRFKLNDS